MARLDKETAVLLSEPLEDIYAEVVDRLVVNISKHLSVGDAKRTAAWEAQKLEEIGQLTAETAKIINQAVKKIPRELRAALEESRRIALSDLERRIEKAIAAGAVQKAPRDSTLAVLENLLNQATERLNLVNTVMMESARTAYATVVNNVVSWEESVLTAEQREQAFAILDQAVFAQATGTETRVQVLKKAIGQMADIGIYGFVDRAGRKWAPEAYVSMDMRTTCHNTAIQSIKSRQQDYGSDIFQVSTHSGARPLCYPYQGKFFSWGSQGGTFTDGDGVRHTYKPISSTSYGKAAGLFGINCGHYPLPQIPGVTIPQDKTQQGKEENDKEYQLSQKQRALERDVRAAKRKAAAYDAAGLQEAFAEQALQVKQKQAAYNAFCKETGRAKRLDRTQVAGYNKSVSAKATAAANRAERVKANKEAGKQQAKIINETIKNSSDPKKLSKLPNEVLKHTIDVEIAKNASLPFGFSAVAPKGIELTNMEVQAGDQTSTPIKDLARLISTYSERDPKYWQKKSGTAYGEKFHYVIHWYENQGYVPIDEIKLKGMKEN